MSTSPAQSTTTTDTTVAANAPDVDSAVADVKNATDVATNFTMSTLDSEEITLADLRGRYVLVNFWATWCIPCRKEMPYLQAISEEYSDQLVVLGVNMREEADRVQPFVEEFGLTFPILLDPPDEFVQEHNVRGLPVTFVVGPEGEIVYRRVGEILPEEFDGWIAENLSGTHG